MTLKADTSLLPHFVAALNTKVDSEMVRKSATIFVATGHYFFAHSSKRQDLSNTESAHRGAGGPACVT